MKQTADDLAVFGGHPAFDRPLHVGRPNVGDRARLLSRLGDILDSRWLTNDGPFVVEFEQRIADMAGARHAVAVCNATIGLGIAARAAGLTGEVIVPAFTFIATPHALQWQGLTPVFCDIDPTTHALDPAQVERMITLRTTGIIGVHMWGEPSGVEEIEDIASRHHLVLMFDAAHAFGCTYRGRPVGTLGAAEVMSFHATKFVNAVEGGAIVTNDDRLAGQARLLRNFGFSGLDSVISLGTNGKMSEVSAAWGLTNLESMETFVAANRSNYERYRLNLVERRGISLFPIDDRDGRRNFQYVVVEIDEAETLLRRDDLIRVLTAENVLARRYFWPGCHRMEPYRSSRPEVSLPHTERIAERVVVLPTGPLVSHTDIDGICELIGYAITHAAELADRFGAATRRR